MYKISKYSNSLSKAPLLASRVLLDYELWLMKHYGRTGNYLTNAKTFLKTYKDGPTVISQIDSYAEGMSLTMQSILRRFRIFFEEKGVVYLINDLLEKKLPIGNIYVKIFLADRRDRLRGDFSTNTYGTILNQFFNLIDQDLRFFNKRWAEKFVHAPTLSDFTKRLYKSVLKNFCDWALLYQGIGDDQLSKEQLLVKKGLKRISAQSLREISSIKVKSSANQLRRYHKESLSIKQRDRLLGLCRNPREKSIISLMTWNGLRTIEVLRLSVKDLKFNERKIAVWGKGKSSTSKDIIHLFDIPKLELSRHFKVNSISRGVAFPGITKKEIGDLVCRLFDQLGVDHDLGKYSPHSLRHTAGQIMYDKNIPLEFIQKTLRHSSLETTMVYAQKAIDRKYFKKMPGKI